MMWTSVWYSINKSYNISFLHSYDYFFHDLKIFIHVFIDFIDINHVRYGKNHFSTVAAVSNNQINNLAEGVTFNISCYGANHCFSCSLFSIHVVATIFHAEQAEDHINKDRRWVHHGRLCGEGVFHQPFHI